MGVSTDQILKRLGRGVVYIGSEDGIFGFSGVGNSIGVGSTFVVGYPLLWFIVMVIGFVWQISVFADDWFFGSQKVECHAITSFFVGCEQASPYMLPDLVHSGVVLACVSVVRRVSTFAFFFTLFQCVDLSRRGRDVALHLTLVVSLSVWSWILGYTSVQEVIEAFSGAVWLTLAGGQQAAYGAYYVAVLLRLVGLLGVIPVVVFAQASVYLFGKIPEVWVDDPLHVDGGVGGSGWRAVFPPPDGADMQAISMLEKVSPQDSGWPMVRLRALRGDRYLKLGLVNSVVEGGGTPQMVSDMEASQQSDMVMTGAVLRRFPGYSQREVLYQGKVAATLFEAYCDVCFQAVAHDPKQFRALFAVVSRVLSEAVVV